MLQMLKRLFAIKRKGTATYPYEPTKDDPIVFRNDGGGLKLWDDSEIHEYELGDPWYINTARLKMTYSAPEEGADFSHNREFYPRPF